MSATAKKASAKKTTAKKAVKKTAKKAATAASIDLGARITLVDPKTENPFRVGTAVYKRVNAVLAAKGQPVEVALKKGARRSTVNYLAKQKVIRLVSTAK